MMGLDINVAFRATPEVVEREQEYWEQIGDGQIRESLDQIEPPEATHVLSSLMRYYGRNYERGNWPQIARLLLDMANHCEQVWYGHDCNGLYELVTPELIDDLSRLWLAEGNRPYMERRTLPPHPETLHDLDQ